MACTVYKNIASVFNKLPKCTKKWLTIHFYKKKISLKKITGVMLLTVILAVQPWPQWPWGSGYPSHILLTPAVPPANAIPLSVLFLFFPVMGLDPCYEGSRSRQQLTLVHPWAFSLPATYSIHMSTEAPSKILRYREDMISWRYLSGYIERTVKCCSKC